MLIILALRDIVFEEGDIMSWHSVRQSNKYPWQNLKSLHSLELFSLGLLCMKMCQLKMFGLPV